MSYNWNWSIFFEPSPEGVGTYLNMLLIGLRWTLVTALLSWIMALVLGSLVGVLRTLPSKRAQRFGFAYIELFRNIPLLVQMFLWYFVLPEVLPAPAGSWLKAMPAAAFITAVLALACFTSARVAVQVSAGIEALPRGLTLAGTAMGLTLAQTYRTILLPV